MQNQAAAAYGRTVQTTASPRELEAQLLLKAAAKLQAIKDSWSGPSDALFEALLYNRKLWTIFAASAAEPDNPHPPAVRNNIGSLAVFVLNRTLALQSHPSSEGLSALININAQIAAGLRGQA